MRITMFVALLFASTLAAGVVAAQPARFNETGVNAVRISESTTKNASALRRISIDRLSPKHTRRPRISDTATKNASAIKRVSTGGLSHKHTSEQQTSESSETVCVIKRVSNVGISSGDIPLPEPELLNPQAAPDCEFKSAAQANDEVALRAMKLDYEQQCYRQSESILRARMERLQDAVGKTIDALNRRIRTSAQ
jgi:hypothetical protein